MLSYILTDDIVTANLKSSGKQLQPRKFFNLNDGLSSDVASYANVNYLTLQHEHQYFMESYIPGRYVRFVAGQAKSGLKLDVIVVMGRVIQCIM